ncbi:DUF2202 domain-containing protein [Candidatus Saccharibacteria bacterium]|nr:DUF2202 domain-containing protein [Candidatus Saccharibacteria bacterium]
MNSKSLMKNLPYILIAVLAVAVVASLGWAYAENKRANELSVKNVTSISQVDTKEQLEDHGIVPLDSSQASNNQTTAEELAYIIEEEKLAYDVYQAMYDRWGSRIFNNIKNSETTHQNMVLAVMESRGLADPRKDELGKFTNQDLQKLYDTLVAQGNQSQVEAYKVGVIIEETDIADLKKILSNLDTKDGDVKAVLENLLSGSENHLRAFNRQVSR